MKYEPKMKVFDFGALQIKSAYGLTWKIHLSHAFWGISYYPAYFKSSVTMKLETNSKRTCKVTCGHARMINDPFLVIDPLFCPQADENEFIDLNCGIQLTKVGLSSDWWFKYKSNSNLNNQTCSFHLQTHFRHFSITQIDKARGCWSKPATNTLCLQPP